MFHFFKCSKHQSGLFLFNPDLYWGSKDYHKLYGASNQNTQGNEKQPHSTGHLILKHNPNITQSTTDHIW